MKHLLCLRYSSGTLEMWQRVEQIQGVVSMELVCIAVFPIARCSTITHECVFSSRIKVNLPIAKILG